MALVSWTRSLARRTKCVFVNLDTVLSWLCSRFAEISRCPRQPCLGAWGSIFYCIIYIVPVPVYFALQVGITACPHAVSCSRAASIYISFHVKITRQGRHLKRPFHPTLLRPQSKNRPTWSLASTQMKFRVLPHIPLE